MFNCEVTPEFVAAKFGITVDAMWGLLGGHRWPHLRYRGLDGPRRDEVIRGILELTDSPDLRVVGQNDNSVWERGWGEILAQVTVKGFEPSRLRPQYFDHHRILRLDGQYIDAGDTTFVYAYDDLLRRIALSNYLQGARKVVELGCGTGTSQLILASLLPNAELVAADWAQSSQDIICAMASYLRRPIRPVRFNMLTLDGWSDLGIETTTTLFTVHALEQLGKNWQALLYKLLDTKPRLCLHLEPIVELYDRSSLFDVLAIKYHERRNYLHGWLTRLRELAALGRAEILQVRRLGFGDRYHEAYSVILWKPL